MASMRPAGRRPSGRLGSELGRRAVSVALDRPGLVAGPAELQRREAPLLDGGEGPDPGRVLPQGPDEALGPQPLPSGARRTAGDGVAPRPGRARAGRRGACAASRGGGGPRGPGRRPRRRRRRARGCPAGSARAPRGVDACALGRAVVEGEDGEPSALGGEGGRPAGAPHGVDPARGRSGRRGGLDREAGPPGSPPTGRCRAASRIRHPSRGRMSRRARRTRSSEGRRRARASRSARLRGPTGATVAPRPSARGGCRRAPAGPPRPGLRPASGPQVPSSGIGPAGPLRHRARRPRPLSRRSRSLGRLAQPVDARACDAADAPDAGCAVAAARGDRDDGARRAGLRGAKGAPAAGLQPVDPGREPPGVHRPLAPPWCAAGRPSRRGRRAPASEGRVAPAAAIGRRHREPARHDLQRPAPPRSTAQRLRPAVIRRSRPGARDRSSPQGLRVRGSYTPSVIHPSTSVGPRWAVRGAPANPEPVERSRTACRLVDDPRRRHLQRRRRHRGARSPRRLIGPRHP